MKVLHQNGKYPLDNWEGYHFHAQPWIYFVRSSHINIHILVISSRLDVAHNSGNLLDYLMGIYHLDTEPSEAVESFDNRNIFTGLPIVWWVATMRFDIC